MKIGIAADHGGFALKEELKKVIQHLPNVDLTDYGAIEYDGQDDYPDCIEPLAVAVGKGEVERGIAVCGSGVGACIIANKVPNVKAALVTESYSAHQGVEHDNMNMICLGGRVIGGAIAEEIVHSFLKAHFIDEGRFRRRLNKLIAIEERYTR
jgi:ribose 5-phosphate isomerase B